MSHQLANSIEIANEFIRRALRDGKPITHMQLQKLVYFANGWNLAVSGEQLLEDLPEAWQFGPVYRRLYDALKRHGSDQLLAPIRQGADTPFADDDGPEAVAKSLIKNEIEVIDKVWLEYGNYPAYKLSALTHAEGSPWAMAFENGKNRIISNGSIQDYFVKLAIEPA